MTNTPRPSCVRIWKAPTNYWCITHQRIQNRSSSKMQMRETQSTAQMTNTVWKDWLQHNFKRISAQTHPAFLGSPSSRRGIWLAIFREYGDLCISAQHRLSGGGVLERTWPLWIYYSGRKVLESPPRNPHLYPETHSPRAKLALQGGCRTTVWLENASAAERQGVIIYPHRVLSGYIFINSFLWARRCPQAMASPRWPLLLPLWLSYR